MTGRVGIRPYCWLTIPTNVASVFRCFILVRDCPDIEISPESGIVSPQIVLRRVVFPLPLGPTNATTSPGLTDKLISIRASVVP